MIFKSIFSKSNGLLIESKEKEAILDISSKLGIPVVEDDPYSLTAFQERKSLP